MIIGTAGHIDHGKTTIVRALTGVDTDRLPEEKSRGISIELGYAYTPLANGEVLGFIDVPGHERLVHTMLAGACGIDFALLVVAADDGVMPQTREHLAILGLLGVSRGAIALTKVDKVDAERRRQAEAEIRELLAPSSLCDAPLFALDATDPGHPGILELREHLHHRACKAAARAHGGLFRLAVDRVFTLPGHGTVATGTVFSGCVRTGDTLAIMPAQQLVRVRSLHAQQRAVETGRAGERCAVNLAGADRRALARGDWLADPRALAASRRLDVRLQLLAANGPFLRPWSTVHVHLGAAHRVAHVVPLEAAQLSPGESARVQLVFAAPFCATAGDRFIVRDTQGRHTIGGGWVLDPAAPERRRRSPERLAWLDAVERMLAGAGIAPLLEHAPFGARIADLVHLTGCALERPPLPAALVVDAGAEQFAILPARWQELRAGVLDALQSFHREMPDEPGPDAGRLRRISFPNAPAALWRALLAGLAAERKLLANGPWLHLPGHRAMLSADDEALLRRLQPLIATGGFDPPWVRELAAAVREPEDRVRGVLRKQLTQGGVYQVVRDLFYDGERIAELAGIVRACSQERAGVTAARFRDAVHLGRKRAIQILEFFDRVGYTRRVRDAHVLRAESPWQTPPSAARADMATLVSRSAAPP
jgi:selenocysteine-specific elongation factor